MSTRFFRQLKLASHKSSTRIIKKLRTCANYEQCNAIVLRKFLAQLKQIISVIVTCFDDVYESKIFEILDYSCAFIVCD